ncbi:MAG TPA: hypothetical protein VN541_14045 [Tepidisphaeraceae bacterium]|nr:hypothetical protein [Tepidisphaeraceae bacterium]
MSQQELLAKVAQVLQQAGLEFMITGSFVSSMQGEPRASHDIDVVVELTQTGASALLAAFTSPDYYLDEHAIRSAMNAQGAFRQFNLLDISQGNKVDFWILSDDPFDQSRFARKHVDSIEGLAVPVSRPEDTILMKLRWADMSGGSEKQVVDALRVFEVQAKRLDLAYMEHWATQLRVLPLWERIQREAKPL